jgi:hypothetical protein
MNIHQLVLISSFIFTTSMAISQSTYYQKTVDSVEIRLIQEKSGNFQIVSINKEQRVDTIWILPVGYVIGPFIDVKFYKDKICMIYQFYPHLMYHLFKWNGSIWESINQDAITWIDQYHGWEVKIVEEGKVFLNQEGKHMLSRYDPNTKVWSHRKSGKNILITYDTETGIELSRTIEK